MVIECRDKQTSYILAGPKETRRHGQDHLHCATAARDHHCMKYTLHCLALQRHCTAKLAALLPPRAMPKHPYPTLHSGCPSPHQGLDTTAWESLSHCETSCVASYSWILGVPVPTSGFVYSFILHETTPWMVYTVTPMRRKHSEYRNFDQIVWIFGAGTVISFDDPG